MCSEKSQKTANFVSISNSVFNWTSDEQKLHTNLFPYVSLLTLLMGVYSID